MSLKKVITADRNDVLFRHRNQLYGAYELRKNKNRREGTALFGGLGFVLFAMFMVLGFRNICTCNEMPANIVNDGDDTAIIKEYDIPDLPEKDLLTMEQPTQSKAIKTELLVAPIVTKHVNNSASIASIDDLLNNVAIDNFSQTGEAGEMPSVDFGEGDGKKTTLILTPPPLEKEVLPDPNKYIFFDKKAQALNLDDIRNRVRYPDVCKQMSIEGTVMIRALIDENGRIIKHLVVKSPHQLLTVAVESELSRLRFQPAESRGKPIKIWVNIPINFQLRK